MFFCFVDLFVVIVYLPGGGKSSSSLSKSTGTYLLAGAGAGAAAAEVLPNAGFFTAGAADSVGGGKSKFAGAGGKSEVSKTGAGGKSDKSKDGDATGGLKVVTGALKLGGAAAGAGACAEERLRSLKDCGASSSSLSNNGITREDAASCCTTTGGAGSNPSSSSSGGGGGGHSSSSSKNAGGGGGKSISIGAAFGLTCIVNAAGLEEPPLRFAEVCGPFALTSFIAS